MFVCVNLRVLVAIDYVWVYELIYVWCDMCRRFQGLAAQYGTNLDVELQQRSVEYSQLFSAFNHMRY